MSGHEFEKQVRQKLNDLKLKPTAQAWENIEEKLRERRRRLAPVFWLPLLLVGLAAGGFLFYQSFEAQDQLAEKQTKTPVKEEAVSRQDNTPQANKPGVSVPHAGVAQPVGPKRSEPQASLPQPGKVQATMPKAGAPQRSNQQAASPFSPSPGAELKSLSATEANKKAIEHAAGGVLHANASNSVSQTNRDLHAFNKIPSLNHLNDKLTISEPSLLNHNKFSSNPSIQKKKSSKWSYGLSGVAGVSSVSEGNFFSLNFNRAQVEDVATVAFFAPQPYQPSSINAGFTYSAGAFVMRELSKKFSISTGINYLQLNTRNKVGSRINARQVVNNGNRGYMFVSSYYSLQQDEPSEYRNRYHFIEVPVELHTRVNKSDKLPMHINTGMAVSRLLKSNSLHFDGSSGVYYKNDKLLNRTQVAAKVGFSFGLLNKTTRPIWVGPYARYNISRILQKDVSASKSFASFGVDMKLFIR